MQATSVGSGRQVLRVLREAREARPQVRLEEWDGQLVVVKDYTVRATRVKLRLGAFLVNREYWAHERLRGIDGIPDPVPSGSPYVLAHVYVPGESAPEVPERLTEEFFEQLQDIVLAMHRRAVAHGDLKRLENILVRPDGSPALIDFSSAIMSGSNPLASPLLWFLQEDDLRGIAKLKARHAPHLLTDADVQLLARRGLVERGWRRIRAYLRPWIQQRSDPKAE